jgi:hypothetical protein
MVRFHCYFDCVRKIGEEKERVKKEKIQSLLVFVCLKEDGIENCNDS